MSRLVKNAFGLMSVIVIACSNTPTEPQYIPKAMQGTYSNDKRTIVITANTISSTADGGLIDTVMGNNSVGGALEWSPIHNGKIVDDSSYIINYGTYTGTGCEVKKTLGIEDNTCRCEGSIGLNGDVLTMAIKGDGCNQYLSGTFNKKAMKSRRQKDGGPADLRRKEGGNSNASPEGSTSFRGNQPENKTISNAERIPKKWRRKWEDRKKGTLVVFTSKAITWTDPKTNEEHAINSVGGTYEDGIFEMATGSYSHQKVDYSCSGTVEEMGNEVMVALKCSNMYSNTNVTFSLTGDSVNQTIDNGTKAFDQGQFGQGKFGKGKLGQGKFGKGKLGEGKFGKGKLGEGKFGKGKFGKGKK